MKDFLPPLALARGPYSALPGKKGKLPTEIFRKVVCPKTGGSVFRFDCDNGFCKCRTEECDHVEPYQERGGSLVLKEIEQIEEEQYAESKRMDEQVDGWDWPSWGPGDEDDIPF
jgi:hypothetical protein